MRSSSSSSRKSSAMSNFSTIRSTRCFLSTTRYHSGSDSSCSRPSGQSSRKRASSGTSTPRPFPPSRVGFSERLKTGISGEISQLRNDETLRSKLSAQRIGRRMDATARKFSIDAFYSLAAPVMTSRSSYSLWKLNHSVASRTGLGFQTAAPVRTKPIQRYRRLEE